MKRLNKVFNLIFFCLSSCDRTHGSNQIAHIPSYLLIYNIKFRGKLYDYNLLIITQYDIVSMCMDVVLQSPSTITICHVFGNYGSLMEMGIMNCTAITSMINILQPMFLGSTIVNLWITKVVVLAILTTTCKMTTNNDAC